MGKLQGSGLPDDRKVVPARLRFALARRIRVTFGWCRVTHVGSKALTGCHRSWLFGAREHAPRKCVFGVLREVCFALDWSFRERIPEEQFGSDLMMHGRGVPRGSTACVEVDLVRPPITWAAACWRRQHAARRPGWPHQLSR